MVLLQNTSRARTCGKPNEGEFRRCHNTHKRFPRVVIGPENAVSQVEIRHSDSVPGIGGRVCVVVDDEDGNRQFFNLFSIIK